MCNPPARVRPDVDDDVVPNHRAHAHGAATADMGTCPNGHIAPFLYAARDGHCGHLGIDARARADAD